MKIETKALIISISIIFLLSSILSIIVYFITKESYLSFFSFIIATILQMVVGFFKSTNYQKSEAKKVEDLIKLIRNGDKTPISLSCAYCRSKNIVPISLTEVNTFKCDKCKGYNKIFIQFSSVRSIESLEERDYLSAEDLMEESSVNDPIEISKS